MLENLDELIEINLKLLNEAPNKSMFRIYFVDEKGKRISRTATFSEILEEKGLIKLEKSKGYRCDLTEFGHEVFVNGGWKKYLENDKEKSKIIAEKDKYDFLSKKWVYKNRLLPYFLSGAALIVSIIMLFINLNKQQDNKKMQKEIDWLKLELKKQELQIKLNKKKPNA